MKQDDRKELVMRVLAVAEAIAVKETGGGLDVRGGARVASKALGVDEGLVSRWRKAAKGEADWPNVRSDTLDAVSAAARKYNVPFAEPARAPSSSASGSHRLQEPTTEPAAETVPTLLLEFLSSGRGGNVTADERAALRTFLTGSHAWEGGAKLEHLDRALRLYRGKPAVLQPASDPVAEANREAKSYRQFPAKPPVAGKKR